MGLVRTDATGEVHALNRFFAIQVLCGQFEREYQARHPPEGPPGRMVSVRPLWLNQ